nr:type II secretion system F family protein [Fodinicola acaciae]
MLAGAGAWTLTGWPVALVLAALGVWWWPALIGSTREHQRRVARSDAIAVWTGHLVASVRAVSGLQQALVRSAALAPDAIAPMINRLATRLQGGQDTREALRKCQAELNDGTGDLVCIALSMAARRSDGLADCLDEIRRVARDDAQLQRDAYAERAASRTAVRIVLGCSAAMVAMIFLLFSDYLAVYRTLPGQMALAVIGAGYAGCLWWMRRAGEIPEQPRILVDAPPAAASRTTTNVLPAASSVWSSAALPGIVPVVAALGIDMAPPIQSLPLLLICGVLIGGGFALVVRGASRYRRPLVELIAASTATLRPPRPWNDEEAPLARTVAWIGVLRPAVRADLRLLNRSLSAHLGRCAFAAVGGCVAGTALSIVGGAPLLVAVVGAVAGAAGGVWWIGHALATDAAARRDRIVHALSVWLDLVAMATRGAAGIDQAIVQATEHICGEGADQIRDGLVAARNSGVPHYRGLQRLATHCQVAEIRDVAAVLELGTTDGTRVRPALRDLAETLRATRRAAVRAQMSAATERIWVPASLTITWLIGLAIFPAVMQLSGVS